MICVMAGQGTLRVAAHHPPLLVTGLGVGVHRTLFRSFSFALGPSQPDDLPITSALLDAAVPIAVRSSNLLAAGVSPPTASAFLGVQDGGGIDPLLAEPRTELGVLIIPGTFNNSAFALRLLAALAESFCEILSRADGAGIWKGVLGGGIEESAGSSDCDNTRGVAVMVPHVMSCLTAAGPISDGEGVGTDGTKL